MKIKGLCASTEELSGQACQIIRYGLAMALIWSIIMSLSIWWYFQSHNRQINAVALAEARAAIETDVLYRRWSTYHGGVYVPVTDKTLPNPNLVNIAEREVTSSSGRVLTIINPAYMTRQVYELALEKKMNRKAHLTSLKPIRPENRPDDWEVEALNSFENGEKEKIEFVKMNGELNIRLMRPFITEKPCLKCHQHQGYHEGDIRGGLSVSLPIAPLAATMKPQLIGNTITHGLIWIVGLIGIIFGTRKLHRHNSVLMQSEFRYRTVADYTSDWEYWRALDGSFIYISPNCSLLCGYSAEEFQRSPHLISEIVHPDDRHAFDNHTNLYNNDLDALQLEFRIITREGMERWISHLCRQVYDASGKPLGYRASNRDITERKQIENEMREQAELLESEIAERQKVQEVLASQQQQLQVLNHSLEERISDAVSELRRKDQMLILQGRQAAMGEMINNIAHQWRQPLNNVGLIVQNIRDAFENGDLTREDMETQVDKAMESIMYMSGTINDFSGFFHPEKESQSFQVDVIVKRALNFLRSTFSSSFIQVDFKEDQNVRVSGFPNEYLQALLNILGNARDVLLERQIADPLIQIRVFMQNNRSVVTISDNGGGIDETALPKIFDPYFTTKDPGKGSGIGLYMSKTIVEKNMNGKLTASNNEQGAVFRIEI